MDAAGTTETNAAETSIQPSVTRERWLKDGRKPFVVTFVVDVIKLLLAFFLTSLVGGRIASNLQAAAWGHQDQVLVHQEKQKEASLVIHQLNGVLGRSLFVAEMGFTRAAGIFRESDVVVDRKADLAEVVSRQEQALWDLGVETSLLIAQARSYFRYFPKEVEEAIASAQFLNNELAHLARQMGDQLDRKVRTFEDLPTAIKRNVAQLQGLVARQRAMTEKVIDDLCLEARGQGVYNIAVRLPDGR
jgi:hypothetical protein